MKKFMLLLLILIIAIIGVVVYLVNIKNNEGKINNTNTNSQNATNNSEENEIEQDNNTNAENVENTNNDDIGGDNMKLNIEVNGRNLIATLAENLSVEGLVERLQEGPVTINMSDYANMEKVGSLGFSLPRNDENISTEAGDIILYQGSSFVIYYGHNNWSLTRLGKIDNISQSELMDILGDGNVTITISLGD